MQKRTHLPVLLTTCAVLAVAPSMARASIVSAATTPDGSFATVIPGSDFAVAGGFGSAPRMLTLRTNAISASGSVTPGPIVTGDAVSGANFSSTPSLSASSAGGLGWDSGANVGIGFAPNQQGGTGITLNSLMLTLFNATTGAAITGGQFSLAPSPLNFTLTNGGTGNQVYALGLTGVEQHEFDILLMQNGGPGNIIAGLAANIGCISGTPNLTTCQVTNSGADTFLGFPLEDVATMGPMNPDLNPIPLPASLPLFAGGLACIGLLGWRRKRKSTASVLAA